VRHFHNCFDADRQGTFKSKLYLFNDNFVTGVSLIIAFLSRHDELM